LNRSIHELFVFKEGLMIELQQFIQRYQQAFQRIYRNINDMMNEHVHANITTDQFTVLQYIAQNNKVTSTEIAREMGVGKSAITALVNRLVQRNMITRERNEQDRRIVYLRMTDEGLYAVQQTKQAIHRYLEDKLSHFPIEDIEKFLLSIEKLAELMEDDKGASS